MKSFLLLIIICLYSCSKESAPQWYEGNYKVVLNHTVSGAHMDSSGKTVWNTQTIQTSGTAKISKGYSAQINILYSDSIQNYINKHTTYYDSSFYYKPTIESIYDRYIYKQVSDGYTHKYIKISNDTFSILQSFAPHNYSYVIKISGFKEK